MDPSRYRLRLAISFTYQKESVRDASRFGRRWGQWRGRVIRASATRQHTVGVDVAGGSGSADSAPRR